MPAFRWNGASIQNRIETEMRARLQAAAILVESHAKRLISTEGTLIRTVNLPATRRRPAKRKGTLIYGANPSSPGNPPHKQTGRLLASITHEVIGLVARIGTNVLYGRFLELGAPKAHLLPRPWLRRALREKTAEVQRILAVPLGSFSNPIDVT